MKLTSTTLIALFGGVAALSQIQPHHTGLVQHKDTQVLAQAQVEGKKKRRRRKSKSCSKSKKSKHSHKSHGSKKSKHSKKSRSPRRRPKRCSRSKSKGCRGGSCNSGNTYRPEYTCTCTEKKCDIIMAHGYKEIFASSTMDIPFSYNKLAQ